MNQFYGKADVIAKGTNSDIDTIEEDIITVPDQGSLSFSQLTMFLDVVLGTHTQMLIRVYCQGEKDGNWYQLVKKEKSTGHIEDDYYAFESDTPARVVIDLPISACFGLKVTGQGIGGANGTATARLLGRTN